MAQSDAEAFYDMQGGDPATGYVTPARAKGAIAQTYADMGLISGPPGGAVLSGWWNYSTATTGPAATGEVRTSGTLAGVGTTGTMWLATVDADGLDWSAITADVDDTFWVRSASGETWLLLITAVPAAGQFSVTLESTTGTAPKKNERVQVSLVRASSGGAQQDTGWRDITTLCDATKVTAGKIAIRRVGNTVWLNATNLTIAANGLLVTFAGNLDGFTLASVSTGLMPFSGWSGWLTRDRNWTGPSGHFVIGPSGDNWGAGLGIGGQVAGGHFGLVSYLTDAPWPTVLPGTPLN